MSKIKITVGRQTPDKPPYGYSHYAHKTVTSDSHDDYIICPFTSIDTLMIFCSCGVWRASASFWDGGAADLAPELLQAWENHKEPKS